MNNIQVNSIDNIGFSNPNSNPNWNQADGNKDGIYFGQLNPNWRENAQREKSLPKEILIFGGGALVLLTALVIYKYVKK
jgi:hypothetical protein